MLNSKQISMLRRGYASTARIMTGKLFAIKNAEDGELGYTNDQEDPLAIYLAFVHKFYCDMPNPGIKMFIDGVFAHELLHQLITDFPVYMHAVKFDVRTGLPRPKYEVPVMSCILNIMEDSMIENFAPNYLGPELVRAIDYMRAVVHKKSAPIDQAGSPYQEFIAASIQFGDAGTLLGDFTSQEAKDIFAKAIPIFSACIDEPSQKRRTELAQEVLDLTRPLWEEEAKAKEEFERKMRELFRRLGITPNTGTCSNDDMADNAPHPRSSRSKRREALSGQFFGSPGNGGENSPVCEGDDNDLPPLSVDDEYVLSNEELQAIKELDKKIEAEERKKAASKEDDETDLNAITVNSGYKGACSTSRVKNIKVTVTGRLTEYKKAVASMRTDIDGITSKLKRIFKSRQEQKYYRVSGSLSTKRLASGRGTPRVFTKRVQPDASDAAVVIAIDISGSMSSSQKYIHARNCAIALVEVFGKLNIPVYVFGFTTDEDKGFDAVHYHYINWSNREEERASLLAISPKDCNFDGYAIRYATELLKHRNEENKLLIVISDGAPCARPYHGNIGPMDVKLAINEAKRVCTPIGVLLGDSDEKRHREMYGFNFIHSKDPSELYEKLCKIISKLI